jgi:hypothetical protein
MISRSDRLLRYRSEEEERLPAPIDINHNNEKAPKAVYAVTSE